MCWFANKHGHCLILPLVLIKESSKAPMTTSQVPQFTSGLDLANLVVSSDLLHLSCDAIKTLHTEIDLCQQHSSNLSLRCKSFNARSDCVIIAFATSPICTKDHVVQGRDLVTSQTLKEEGFSYFDFLCSKGNQSFSFRRAAISLFRYHFQELSQLKAQICDPSGGESTVDTRFITTGHALGGAIATLFTLWLLDSIKRPNNRNQSSPKLPLCITFGSPLIGDQGLQRAIMDHSKWNSCFLHVVDNKDLLPRIFVSVDNFSQAHSPYKAFGAFFLCSELGCSCFDDPEVISRLLDCTSQDSNEVKNIDYYGKILEVMKSRTNIKAYSQLSLSDTSSLRARIMLQLEAIGMKGNFQQQLKNGNFDMLVEELEKQESIRLQVMKPLDPNKTLNEVKKRMALLEWYKKDCKDVKIGYYDSYKNLHSNSDRDVTKYKKYLNNYWRKEVEDAERKPQKEGPFIRDAWLFAGTNYRRMVEPLDIAEYYRENENGDYQTQGRSRHYVLLEQWQKEEAEKSATKPNNKKKQNVAGNLTEDSCFWANVEKARISCKKLKDESSSATEKQSAKEDLKMFEQYVMAQINNYAVSPEIFLAQTSFLKWWKDFQEIVGTSHHSPLSNFMKDYGLYEKGMY